MVGIHIAAPANWSAEELSDRNGRAPTHALVHPKDGTFEWTEVPKSDEEAISLLSSSPYTQSCTDTYWYWRKLDASIMAALIRAGEQAIEERN